MTKIMTIANIGKATIGRLALYAVTALVLLAVLLVTHEYIRYEITELWQTMVLVTVDAYIGVGAYKIVKKETKPEG